MCHWITLGRNDMDFILPELSELDSGFFAVGLGTPGLAAAAFAGAGFAGGGDYRSVSYNFKSLKPWSRKLGVLLPAAFLSPSLLSSLLSEESLSAAFLAAGAAGGFWIEVGGGTALYAPTKTKEKISIL